MMRKREDGKHKEKYGNDRIRKQCGTRERSKRDEGGQEEKMKGQEEEEIGGFGGRGRAGH